MGSLLLGLYDDAGLLHHAGFTSALKAEDRAELTARLEKLIEPPGFTGDAPGGPSRWANARSAEWQPLKSELVVEVRYDQVTGRRFRHGTGLLRWRPDKGPEQCTFDQLTPELRPSELAELFGAYPPNRSSRAKSRDNSPHLSRLRSTRTEFGSGRQVKQAKLFDEPPIAGLLHCENFITVDEEQAILQQLDALDLAPFRFHGWIGKRKTHSFGWRYDFDDSSFTEAEPLPDWLIPLSAKAAEFARIDANRIVHAMIARYDPGAGIGWHRDRPVFEKVVGISLGTAATMRFRQRAATSFRRAKLELAPRSAYLLSGEVRHEWEHSIVPGQELRFSITFRTLSDIGRRKREVQRSS